MHISFSFKVKVNWAEFWQTFGRQMKFDKIRSHEILTSCAPYYAQRAMQCDGVLYLLVIIYVLFALTTLIILLCYFVVSNSISYFFSIFKACKHGIATKCQ